jgi:hypothetical protein
MGMPLGEEAMRNVAQTPIAPFGGLSWEHGNWRYTAKSGRGMRCLRDGVKQMLCLANSKLSLAINNQRLRRHEQMRTERLCRSLFSQHAGLSSFPSSKK